MIQLKDSIKELRKKHERINVETSVQACPIYNTVYINTDDTSLNYQSSFVQVNLDRSQSPSRTPTVVPMSSFDGLESGERDLYTDDFDDITQLIAVLNH